MANPNDLPKPIKLPIEKIEELRSQEKLSSNEMLMLKIKSGINLWYLLTGEGDTYTPRGNSQVYIRRSKSIKQL